MAFQLSKSLTSLYDVQDMFFRASEPVTENEEM